MITNSPFLSYCDYSTVYPSCPYSRITKSNSTSLYCWAGLGNIMGYHWPTTQKKKDIACLALLIWHFWFDSLWNLGVSLSPLKGNSTWTPYVYMGGGLHAHIFLGSFSSSWFPWLFQMSSLLVILPHTVVHPPLPTPSFLFHYFPLLLHITCILSPISPDTHPRGLLLAS